MVWAMEHEGYSQRRACKLVGIEPKAYRYASRRPDDGAVRARLRALAGERRRFGYRRLHILLARDGVRLNHKRLYRIYREERLGVRKRGGRKRALGMRSPMALPQRPNQRWSLDFVSDALASGRRFRVLAVVDDFTRECLGLVVGTSLSGLHVGRELDRFAELQGKLFDEAERAFRGLDEPCGTPAYASAGTWRAGLHQRHDRAHCRAIHGTLRPVRGWLDPTRGDLIPCWP